MSDNIAIGKMGEETACRFLLKKGYVIVERNFKCRMGEIDIIAKKENSIVFVEVKTRNGDMFGMPCEAVNYKKRRKIMNSAAYYMLLHCEYGKSDVSFDVIEVLVSGRNTRINHIENAFGKEVL